MAFVQTDATVPVEMTVTRYRVFRDDGMAELWGYVGDYEVCVHLPLDHPSVRLVLGEEAPAGRNPKRRQA